MTQLNNIRTARAMRNGYCTDLCAYNFIRNRIGMLIFCRFQTEPSIDKTITTSIDISFSPSIDLDNPVSIDIDPHLIDILANF